MHLHSSNSALYTNAGTVHKTLNAHISVCPPTEMDGFNMKPTICKIIYAATSNRWRWQRRKDSRSSAEISRVFHQFSQMNAFKDLYEDDIIRNYIDVVRFCQWNCCFGGGSWKALVSEEWKSQRTIDRIGYAVIIPSFDSWGLIADLPHKFHELIEEI